MRQLIDRVASPLRRWRAVLTEAWRFGLVGAANVIINFLAFNALVLSLFPDGQLKANVVATAVATTTSYLMNRSWTFRHRRTSRIPREFVLFVAFNVAGLAIELAVMGLAKYGLGLASLWALNLAKAAGLGLGTVFRFWTYRTFVFRAAREAPATRGAEPVNPALSTEPVHPALSTEPAEPAKPGADPVAPAGPAEPGADPPFGDRAPAPAPARTPAH